MMTAPEPYRLKLSERGHTTKPRLPILDTHHPGIHLSRSRKYAQNRTAATKTIVVISIQTIWRAGEPETMATHVGQVSERAYRKHASQTEARFYQLLDDALAISRYVDREVARGCPPKTLVHLKDLSAADREVQGNWEHIKLPVLFDSYRLDDPQFHPSTTFGDQVAVTTRLQTADLREPHKSVALNGHHLKFKAMAIGGDTFYLPTGICRLRHGWRLFIRHQDGVWWDVIDDEPGQSLDASLREAWLYFVSQLRALTPPAKALSPVTLQRCYTGVEGGTFIMHEKAYGWGFQLRYSQKLMDGRRFNTTVAYWREDTVSEQSLRLALRHLAAMDAYRKHLLASDPSADVKLTNETSIPLAFWPEDPVIPLSVDDLIYETELR